MPTNELSGNANPTTVTRNPAVGEAPSLFLSLNSKFMGDKEKKGGRCRRPSGRRNDQPWRWANAVRHRSDDHLFVLRRVNMIIIV